MRSPKYFGFTAVAILALGGLSATACGDDDALVRQRVDGGGVFGLVEGGAGLACGAAVPTRYESSNFMGNAAVQIALGARARELDAAMAATEGASNTTATAATLAGIFNGGAPSLRTVSTTFTQTTVDGYLTAFGVAGGKTWKPTDAEADGGATTGGKYGALFYESAAGLDLRAATGKTILGGALYNHVLGLVAGTITDATIDQLVAAFGANPALANRTDVEAGPAGDLLVAELASKRDDKAAGSGIYRRAKDAVLRMKGAVAGGASCKADLDAAVATFLLEWEHATYASAIFALNTASTSAADPAKGPLSLHSYGDALGLIQSFKGLPGQRKITDAQIDALLGRIGADSPFKLVTNPGTRALALSDAINDIKLYEGFSDPEVAAFKQSF